jgi:hypothetical protein
MLNRTKRRPANMVKKRVALTDSAPQAKTKGRSGKGGSRRAGRTSATAPLWLTWRLTLSNTPGDIQCSSPFLPILRPIQKTIAAPIKDPAVARKGRSQTISE